MTDVAITPLDERRFGVAITEGENTTHHEVSVPQEMLDDLVLPPDDAERLVRESVAFLLEREPSTSIRHAFSLNDIASYFPEYPAEIRLRLEG